MRILPAPVTAARLATEASVSQRTLYRDIEARDFGANNNSGKTQLQHLVLNAGIMQETMWIEFAGKALVILAASPE